MAEFSQNDALSQFLAVGQRNTAGGAIDSYSLLNSQTGQITTPTPGTVSNGPGPSDNKQAFDFAGGIIGALTPALASIANTVVTTEAQKKIASSAFRPAFGFAPVENKPVAAKPSTPWTTYAIGAGVVAGGLYALSRIFGKKRR